MPIVPKQKNPGRAQNLEDRQKVGKDREWGTVFEPKRTACAKVQKQESTPLFLRVRNLEDKLNTWCLQAFPRRAPSKQAHAPRSAIISVKQVSKLRG